MMIHTPQPHPSLSGIIKEYYFLQLDATGSSKQMPIVDDGCNDFVVYKEADAFFSYGNQQREQRILHRVFTVLNVALPYQLRFKNSLTFFTIKCQPWMNRYFFRR